MWHVSSSSGVATLRTCYLLTYYSIQLKKPIGVMEDDSGESMELIEEVPMKELGNAELERLAGS